jgi:ABC-2 type transport system ATP-binding protein
MLPDGQTVPLSANSDGQATPTSAAEDVVTVRGLRKFYGELEAVRGVDFAIPRGTIFGLLGPNGAGKTTIVEILEGYRTRSGGEVEVLGTDPQRDERALRDRVGIVLQESGLEPDLTVSEAIDLYGAAYSRPRPTGELVELVGLRSHARARVGSLSGGERRRLDLALGIVGHPDLLYLDEPTTGFDPEARRRSWQLIGTLRDEGKTILLTTHYMEEAQRLADRVAVLAHGRILASGSPDQLTDSRQLEAEVAFALPAGFAATDLPLPDAALARANGRVVFTTPTPTRDLAPLLAWATERGIELDGLAVRRATLEDVYLSLTAHADPEGDR